MRQYQKEKREKKFSHFQILTMVLFFLVGFLSFLQVIVSNRLATLGEYLKEKQEESLIFEEENKRVQEEMEVKLSLINLTSEAKKLGLGNPEAILYLSPQIPLTMRSL